ncbi:MAG: hypothetical protein Q7V19_11510 [Bacteroidales bacterium]|nr:hypothetical protein [Bacteroidales bacterium]
MQVFELFINFCKDVLVFKRTVFGIYGSGAGIPFPLCDNRKMDIEFIWLGAADSRRTEPVNECTVAFWRLPYLCFCIFDNGLTTRSKKTIQRTSVDAGLMFTNSNLRKILNVIGKERLRRFVFDFFSVFDRRFDFIGAILANASKTVVYFA